MLFLYQMRYFFFLRAWDKRGCPGDGGIPRTAEDANMGAFAFWEYGVLVEIPNQHVIYRLWGEGSFRYFLEKFQLFPNTCDLRVRVFKFDHKCDKMTHSIAHFMHENVVFRLAFSPGGAVDSSISGISSGFLSQDMGLKRGECAVEKCAILK